MKNEFTYSAMAIKNWIITEMSPFVWSTIITRALPELLENNPGFSAYYVTEKTRWGEIEVQIIQMYLLKMYKKSIPSDLLVENSNCRIENPIGLNIDFFDVKKILSLNAIRKLFNF